MDVERLSLLTNDRSLLSGRIPDFILLTELGKGCGEAGVTSVVFIKVYVYRAIYSILVPYVSLTNEVNHITYLER